MTIFISWILSSPPLSGVFMTCGHVVVPYIVKEFSSVRTVIPKLCIWKVMKAEE